MRDPWQVGEVDVDAYTEQDDCPSGDARPYTHCREEEEGSTCAVVLLLSQRMEKRGIFNFREFREFREI